MNDLNGGIVLTHLPGHGQDRRERRARFNGAVVDLRLQRLRVANARLVNVTVTPACVCGGAMLNTNGFGSVSGFVLSDTLNSDYICTSCNRDDRPIRVVGVFDADLRTIVFTTPVDDLDALTMLVTSANVLLAPLLRDDVTAAILDFVAEWYADLVTVSNGT